MHEIAAAADGTVADRKSWHGLHDDGPLPIALVALGAIALWWIAHGGARFRAGPWPGLTERGAGVLLACAVILGGVELWLGPPRRALPDLVLLAALSVVPLALASVIIDSPGAAAAASGAFLLSRSLVSLIDRSIELPPLLLVGAVALELGAWLRWSDLGGVGDIWPRRQQRWKRRNRAPRRLRTYRLALGGAAYGCVLCVCERPFALFMGGQADAWSTSDTVGAAALSSAVCAAIGALAAACASVAEVQDHYRQQRPQND